jgi:hypothetical protein
MGNLVNPRHNKKVKKDDNSSEKGGEDISENDIPLSQLDKRIKKRPSR